MTIIDKRWCDHCQIKATTLDLDELRRLGWRPDKIKTPLSSGWICNACVKILEDKALGEARKLAKKEGLPLLKKLGRSVLRGLRKLWRRKG